MLCCTVLYDPGRSWAVQNHLMHLIHDTFTKNDASKPNTIIIKATIMLYLYLVQITMERLINIR